MEATVAHEVSARFRRCSTASRRRGIWKFHFTEDARHQLLRCQPEQSLLAEDCGRVGDSVCEAHHGQAAGHIGIFSALLAILHLAEIIIRVNLLLKQELRREEHQPQNRPPGVDTAVAHRAVALDRGAAALVRAHGQW